MCHRLLFVMDLFCSLCCLPFCRLSCCRRPKSEFLRGVRDIKDCLGCALDSVEKRRLPKVPDEDKDNDHHDELLVVSPHRRVSISDSTAEMASILCHVILLLSVMTQPSVAIGTFSRVHRPITIKPQFICGYLRKGYRSDLLSLQQ